MGFWSKAKGFFGRIGKGIGKVAKATYNTAKGVISKFGPLIGAGVSTALTGDPTSGAQVGKMAQGVANFLPNA